MVQVSRFHRDISKASAQAIPGADYTGKALRPKVVLVYQGKQVSGTNYTVDYQNNVHAGTAKAVITGINN